MMTSLESLLSFPSALYDDKIKVEAYYSCKDRTVKRDLSMAARVKSKPSTISPARTGGSTERSEIMCSNLSEGVTQIKEIAHDAFTLDIGTLREEMKM